MNIVTTNNAAASKVAVQKRRELNIDQFLKQKGEIAVRVAQWVLQRNDARMTACAGSSATLGIFADKPNVFYLFYEISNKPVL
jgi:hypothetical protein